MALETKAFLYPKAVLNSALYNRLRLVSLLEMRETDFSRLIAEVERDPLFARFCFPQDRGRKAIYKKRSPRTRQHAFRRGDLRPMGAGHEKPPCQSGDVAALEALFNLDPPISPSALCPPSPAWPLCTRIPVL